MTHRLTQNIMQRTNAQRKRLGRAMLSRAGFEAALKTFEFNHVDDVLVVAMVGWIVPQGKIAEYTSPYELPAERAAEPLKTLLSTGPHEYSPAPLRDRS